MAHLRRLMYRFWCGAFPHFHILSCDDALHHMERDAISAVFFGSYEFADLRMQLRLKLQETPAITQTTRRGLATQYADLIALTDKYCQYVVALLRYIHSTTATATATTEIGATYVPLFYGVGAADLRCERLVSKDHRLHIALPVDVVQVFFLLGQLHALHAEALVDQGVQLQSAVIVRAAEASWRNSTLQFTRAASIANAALAMTAVGGDPQASTVLKFLTKIATQAIVLARLAQVHRAATRIISVRQVLVDETIERLARHAVVCARFAYGVVEQLAEIASVLDDTPFSRQLMWLIQSYAVRWRAIFYSYEQTVFQLDFHPEIAIQYCELIQRGEKLPSVPEYSHRHDTYFTRITQELQQSHATHLNQAMDDKASVLLPLCQRKLGAVWTLEQLPRELTDALATIPAFDDLFGDENASLGDLWSGDGHGENQGNPTETLTVEVIASHVQSARERAGLETTSLFAYSVKTVDGQRTGEAEPLQHPRPPLTRPSSASASMASPSTSLMKKKKDASPSGATTTSDWVTLQVGAKTLHFEPLPSPSTAAAATQQQIRRPPRPVTAGAAPMNRRRNAMPMVIDDTQDRLDAQANQADATRRLTKNRPFSSPSYLRGSASSKKPSSSEGSGALTWVPTRMACALCERRFVRANLPGVVVMKRIFDLRRKWGMVLQDSKKFSAASALYGQASVCLMCQDILTFEDDQASCSQESCSSSLAQATAASSSSCDPISTASDDIGFLILSRIKRNWDQRPTPSNELLLDVAVNKRARQSSTNFGLSAPNAVLADSIRTAHTKEERQPWWEVDLGNYYVIHSIKIWLREDTSHVYTFGGGGGRNGLHPRPGIKPATATATAAGGSTATGEPVLALSSVGFLHGGAGLGMACGALAPAPQPNLGLYPLHICVSMKTGVDRDLDDILASAVRSHCIAHKAVQPITWLTPPNCRGRFVRIQCEGLAFLHIERVNVFVTHDLPIHSAVKKRETARNQLQRAAFRASVIRVKPSSQPNDTHQFNEHDALQAARAFQGRARPVTGPVVKETSPNNNHTDDNANNNSTSASNAMRSLFTSALVDPQQAETRRISRLYLKFKGLLDARAKYAAPVTASPGATAEKASSKLMQFKRIAE